MIKFCSVVRTIVNSSFPKLTNRIFKTFFFALALLSGLLYFLLFRSLNKAIILLVIFCNNLFITLIIFHIIAKNIKAIKTVSPSISLPFITVLTVHRIKCVKTVYEGCLMRFLTSIYPCFTLRLHFHFLMHKVFTT